MIETLLNQARQGKSALEQQQLLREQLQHLILQEMDRMGFFENICFLGGTALRILHNLNRFSEDLDFSSQAGISKDALVSSLNQLQKNLVALGTQMKELKIKTHNAVISTFFSFSGLLGQVNKKAFQKDQLLSIKVDIDSNPPKGAKEEISTIRGVRLYSIRHYSLSSLFSGKLHALLHRNYTKGRDIYDFFWYTAKKQLANKILLENTIAQTTGEKPDLTDGDLKMLLSRRAKELDFHKAHDELKRFLADPEELKIISKDHFISQIEHVGLEKMGS